MESSLGVNWKFVIIAAALIYLVSIVAGFIISMSGPLNLAAIAISNTVVILIGLTAIGSMRPSQRWKNIMLVSAGIWLLSISNIALGFSSFPQWLLAFFYIGLVGGVAGVLSLLVTGLIKASTKPTG